MKNIIVITGGAGFVGSNLVKKIIDTTNFNVVSLDNYSSGTKKNHIKNKRVSYIKADTFEIFNVLSSKKNKIHSLFHFGEFPRIYQSFIKLDECINSNSIGSYQVFKFCIKNKIKLIYSATSATIGNYGRDKDLSPYAFTKAKNLELLENLKNWYNFKFEIVYFYNVYGPGQIETGSMATVIGIFEKQFKEKKHLTVVKPGTQTRKFTHIDDTIDVCIFAWKQNKCRHYSISSKKSYSIKEVAKMFSEKIKYLPKRPGERFASASSKQSLSNKIYQIYGKKTLKSYINSFLINFK